MKGLNPFRISLLLLAAVSLNATAQNRTLAVGERPESVTRGFGDLLYVTVMNKPDKEGDGVIKVISGEEVTDFATGMNEPKGICFNGDYLFCTDVTKVWQVNEAGEATVLVDEEAFPGKISFLNDIVCAKNRREVFVTDMGSPKRLFGKGGMWDLESVAAKEVEALGRVFKVDLKTSEVSVEVDSSPLMPAPNGVGIAKSNRLLIGEFFYGTLLEAYKGKLTPITLKDRTGVRATTQIVRGADAVEQDSAGNYYISSWTQGFVAKFDKNGIGPKYLIQGLQSAADFYLDEKNDEIVLPDMLAGTVIFVPLD